MVQALQFGDEEYVAHEMLRQADNALFRARRRRDGRSVLVRLLPSAHVQNAFNAARDVPARLVAVPIAWHAGTGMGALILDDDGSEPLERSLHMPLTLKPFLRLSIRLAGLLVDLHASGWVHKNVKPGSILIHPVTQALKFLDLELASPLGDQNPVSPGGLKGSLPYISPEQTGRLNHAVDSRADLYSLGALLFQLRSAKLPFHAEDPLGWVYRHLAQAPPKLKDVTPRTPDVVSDIVDKLLEKTPESRYQSAVGLRLDLQRCLDQLLTDKRIDPFEIATRDTSDRFWVPQRLYGRQKELQALLDIFEQVIHRGAPILVSVSGYAGVGKSTLVHELYKPLLRERGFFLEGKFDRNKRDIPYSTLSQAFGEIIRRRLTESEDQIQRWRSRLHAALGPNGQLMVDLIPDVEALIGKQPPVPSMPLEEADRRLRVVFRRFLATFTLREHPLALFLDDLQWADPATLQLMEDVLAHPDSKYFMLILAYRSNEVGPTHPLLDMFERLRREGCELRHIPLKPLSAAHVQELVADAVRRPKKDVEGLAQLVHEKTAGNPFFAVQLLTTLHQEDFIQFDRSSSEWRWNLESIRARGFSTEVVDLTAMRIQSLPERTRDMLRIVACVGNVSPMPVLVAALGVPEDTVHGHLWEAVRAGVLSRSRTGYRFVHDRLQQAALSLIPEEERAGVHLSLGRTLLEMTPPALVPERVFDIVNQLNLGLSKMTDPAERLRTAELNLLAARKAKGAGAYGSAVERTRSGLALLPDDAWATAYRLSFDLHVERFQAELLNKNFEAAEALFQDLKQRCQQMVERAAVYAIGIQLFTTKGQVGQAVSLSVEYLALCNIEVPLHPTLEQVKTECDRTLAALGDRSIEDLPSLEEPDAETSALLSVMSLALPAALFFDTQTSAILSSHSLRIILEKGAPNSAPVVLNSFAMVLGSFFGEYRAGYRFGKAGLELLERRKLEGIRGAVYLMFGCLVSFWVQPLSRVIPYLENSIRAATAAGDLTYACYSCTLLVTALLAQGRTLAEVQREAEHRQEFVHRERFREVENGLISAQLFIQHMRGYGDLLEEEHERHVQKSWPIEICLFYIRKLQSRFFLGRYAEALEAAERARPFVWSSENLIQSSEYVFFHALTLLQLGRVEGVWEHERRLARWAENCPENFLARSALVSAEGARVQGRELDAARLYEQAINAAKLHGAKPIEALACELAGKFYQQRGFDLIARTYLGAARKAYAQWGADAKVKALEEEHPQLKPADKLSPEGTVTLVASELDLLSVTKASQTISREIRLDALARTLLEVLMEHAGAQRGCLVLRDRRHLKIRATAKLVDSSVRVELLPDIPLEGSGRAPERVLLQVVRTNEPVILDAKTLQGTEFEHDEYIRAHRPRSMVGLPISRGSELEGLLYIENELVSEAFGPERLKALEILAAQAAISLQNAQLLEQERKARKLAEASQKRLALLSEVSKLFTETLEREAILTQLSEFLVRELADWCVFDFVEKERIVRRMGTHRDPELRATLRELALFYPPTYATGHPVARVLRSGQSLLLREITASDSRRAADDARHFRIIQELGTRSAVIVPMRLGTELFGALTVASSVAGRYTPEDVELLEELAHRTVAAVERARLYRQAREAIELRDEFLTVASHELKTPLTPLQLHAASLKKQIPKMIPDSTSARWVESRLEVMLRQSNRLGRLINELLDISRIAAGGLQLELAAVDMSAVVRDVVRTLEEQDELTRAGSPLRMTLEPHVFGRWDRLRVEQVVTNLLSNALKFGPGKPIEVNVRELEKEALLIVRDHGIGILPDALERIFGRFERAVSQRHYGGLGLGLYIVRKIVEALGGNIHVESRHGEGSTFIVRLPLSGPVPLQALPGVPEEPGPVHMH